MASSKMNSIQDSNDQRIFGEFYYRAMDDRIERCCPFVYEDSYFDHPTNVPNFDLIRLSLKIAMSASRKKDILRFYDDIGFSYTASTNYKKENLNILAGDKVTDSVYYPAQTINGKDYINSIAYAIGFKKLENKTILLVAVRGGNYGIEWGGNFYVGNEVNHIGFKIASDQVIAGIKDALSQVEGPVRVHLCGYSRSAAVSNLTAARINQGEIEGLNKDNVSCYTYEAPRVTRDINALSSDYDNIYNIINPGDLIPTFVFGDWGYKRYGKELNLPAYQTSRRFLEKFKKMEEVMLSHLKTIYDLSYDDAHIIDKFVSNLAFIMKSPDNYVKYYQDLIIKIFMNFDTGVVNLTEDERDLIERLKRNLYLMDPITYNRIKPILIKGKDILEFNFESPLLSNHKMGTELSWIESFKDISDFGFGNYLLAYFDNIENVKITADKNILFSSENSKESHNYLWSGKNLNGQTVVVLDEDRDYHIEINNVEDSASYCLYNFDQKEGVINSGLIFNHSDINNTSGEISKELRNLNLFKEKTKINPERRYLENIDKFLVNVTKEGLGEYIGGGYFYPGMLCRLEAKPKDGKFKGWFVFGKCVSKELVYVFRPNKSITLVAKFE